MELINKLKDIYGPGESWQEVENQTKSISEAPIAGAKRMELLRKAFSCIDLTSLNTQDNNAVASRMCSNINRFETEFPDLDNVAAICVYPALLNEVKKNLTAKDVSIAVVGAGFPSSQTFLSVKLAECELLAARGADEIDIVLSVGKFLEGNFQYVSNEISLIKKSIGNAHLKVILETGKLSPENIRIASLLALESGADFIKTSTGKENPAATPEAVYIMARAIQDYYSASGKKAGIKPAGGISSPDDALVYLKIVGEILGDEWHQKELFRIGASRLANHLLSEVLGQETIFF